MKAQLKELASNNIFKTFFPNLRKIRGAICLSIPVMTASLERTNKAKYLILQSKCLFEI